MKKLFKLVKFVFIVAFIFGGWALAAASLHVVRAPGSMLWEKVPVNVQVIPKNTLTFKETYIDTTKWQLAEYDAHSALLDRLPPATKLAVKDRINQNSAPSEATASAAPPVSRSLSLEKRAVSPSVPSTSMPDLTISPSLSTPTATPDQPKAKSIFDFGK